MDSESKSKRKKVDLWMPLYITDYLGDTMHLTTEQHGAYMLMLMAAWKNDGSIKDDDKHIKQVTRLGDKSFKESIETLRAFFVAENGALRHKRIDNELEKSKSNKKQKIAAGNASAEARKSQRKRNGRCNENATDVATNEQRQVNPSPSPYNLPTVVIENPPSQCSDSLGRIDAETGEVVQWAA